MFDIHGIFLNTCTHISTSSKAMADFVLMAIHVKPDDAVAEINYLTNSTDEIKSLW